MWATHHLCHACSLFFVLFCFVFSPNNPLKILLTIHSLPSLTRFCPAHRWSRSALHYCFMPSRLPYFRQSCCKMRKRTLAHRRTAKYGWRKGRTERAAPEAWRGCADRGPRMWQGGLPGSHLTVKWGDHSPRQGDKRTPRGRPILTRRTEYEIPTRHPVSGELVTTGRKIIKLEPPPHTLSPCL